MLRTRIIPTLLLKNESLVKTVRFGRFTYVGDPCNTVRIFNELEADELLILDISATAEKREPNLALLEDIAKECFMPLAYGGGLRTFEKAQAVLKSGFEKVVVNSFANECPHFITKLAEHFGNQAVIASIDVKRSYFGRYEVRTCSGRVSTDCHPVEWAQELESLGAGEILLTSIDREGTWRGFDLELLKSVTKAVSIPVIAHGGAGSLQDIGDIVIEGGASAVAVGSMVVFQKKNMGVLINFPSRKEISAIIKTY